MDKWEKAQKLLDEGKVFCRGKRGDKLYFIVAGKKERAYEVIRDGRGKPKYHCNCKYFKADECSHIIAATLYAISHKLLDGGQNDKPKGDS